MTYLPSHDIKVKVENGRVSLIGQVQWDYQRREALAAIRHLVGVIGVNDQITLRPIVSAPVVKADIESALKRRTQKARARDFCRGRGERGDADRRSQQLGGARAGQDFCLGGAWGSGRA